MIAAQGVSHAHSQIIAKFSSSNACNVERMFGAFVMVAAVMAGGVVIVVRVQARWCSSSHLCVKPSITKINRRNKMWQVERSKFAAVFVRA